MRGVAEGVGEQAREDGFQNQAGSAGNGKDAVNEPELRRKRNLCDLHRCRWGHSRKLCRCRGKLLYLYHKRAGIAAEIGERSGYFLFQRTPCLVFSTTMPAWASWARMASDLAKSRALRARSCSTTRASTCSSGRPLERPTSTSSLAALSSLPSALAHSRTRFILGASSSRSTAKMSSNWRNAFCRGTRS